MTLSPKELQVTVRGVLAFVSTPFAEDGEVDIPRWREHLRATILETAETPEGCFVCCGTGEFYSLDLDEYGALVEAAVDVLGGKVPVFAGTGYGTRLAIQFARGAEERGADGLLVFPPYLTTAPQEGLYRHLKKVAESTGLGLIVYSRDNAVLEPETVVRLSEISNVIGLKDGHGDLAALKHIRNLVGPHFALINGMPLAEMYAPAYHEIGVTGYSPNVIELFPELTWALYHAIEVDDDVEIKRLFAGFFGPWGQLRLKVPGYGVALVKAGLRLLGRSVGGVRPPLVDPAPDHEEELRQLIGRAHSLVR